MEKSIVLIDAGFLSKLSKYFGKGSYLSYDIIKLAKLLSEKLNFSCEHIFYYTAPPFQSEKPLPEEIKRYSKYETFKTKLSKNKIITIREGRCQRVKIDGKFVYKQKAVDTLMVMDLILIPIKFKEVNKIILLASDSDFVPVVKELKELKKEVFLYTYYINKRDTNFSRSNHLLNSVTRYFKLTKKDFEDCPLG